MSKIYAQYPFVHGIGWLDGVVFLFSKVNNGAFSAETGIARLSAFRRLCGTDLG